MPQLRKDPVTGRWVIISTDRQKRPNDFRFERAAIIGREHCPFCPGHEAMTPPEVMAYRQNGGAANGPGWDVRVVPNKYPALQVEGGFDREGEGMYDRMNGVGAHEVIIETPHHERTIAAMSEAEIVQVLWAFRERMLDLKRDVRLKHILIFENHGAAAGATLEHPHAQLIALPIVPDFVREEIDGARRHFRVKERCVFCDIVRQDLADGRRVVLENADAVALAPFAPRFAFETWVIPKRHGARFEEAARHEYEGLARLLNALAQRMNRALEEPDYNLIVHTSPFGDDTTDVYHWHVEILPKLTRVAGFEWGTGFYINPTPPEEAARVLRSVRL
jgi:UDPglucose--hexose-1-phosphate uridylyltransferase